MFNIGFTELLLISFVALVVIGPKELPATMRELGRIFGKIKRIGSEFIDEIMREPAPKKYITDLEGKRQETYELGDINPAKKDDSE